MARTRRVIVLGSTGSIGTQTLEVIEHLNALHARGEFADRFQVVGLAAGRNAELLEAQARRFGVRQTSLHMLESDQLSLLQESCSGAGDDWSTRRGDEAATKLVQQVDCDIVVAAITGVAGLPATLAAVELGRDIALANKETLVAAGSLIVPAARRSGSKLLPVDSEHSGVWQCLGNREAGAPPPLALALDREVTRIILTASGGPFRTWTKDRIDNATVKEALNHPTWSMGKKVTIDSASLMNKALEIIEAHWLFGLSGDKIQAMIHPQSIVHAMVEFADGSVVTQMGAPDMRTPIQHALTWPGRAHGCSKRIDSLTRLDFEEPDVTRFPALKLAYCAIAEGGNSGAVLNAANEAAVLAFLEGRISFGRIAELARRAMDTVPVRAVSSVEDVLDADRLARAVVNSG